MDAKEIIARRAALELCDGDVVNLGIGLPTLVASYVPEDVDIVLQSENGILGMKGIAGEGEINKNIVNAGGANVTVKKDACFFDSATSFMIIRGGHVDKTMLGALEVDQSGSLASHIIPGKMVPGMGGAMDLVSGSKKVIVLTTHTAKGNSPKILKKCTLPLTAVSKVNMIITELAVIEVTPKGLLLKEVASGHTVEEVVSLTDADLIINEEIKVFGE